VPTLAESGLPGYETSAWFGILVPAATPRETVQFLSDAFNRIMRLPDVQHRLADLGATPTPDTSAEFASFIAAETTKWSKLARDAHVTAE
jgi:tripartite-type tricarboxylate transporter receptor subunit TctC